MSEDDCCGAAEAAGEGAPSETPALLPAPSSVAVRSRSSAPLSRDGAGVCAARVTNDWTRSNKAFTVKLTLSCIELWHECLN